MFTPLLAVTVLAGTVQDAQSILETQRTREQARWAEVENYTVELTTDQGVTWPVYRERLQVAGQYAFRIVPPGEWQGDGVTSDQVEEVADVLAGVLDRVGPQAMAAVPAGPLGLMLINGMDAAAAGLRGAGDAAREYEARAPDPQADALAAINGLQAFAERARLVGRETINGRPAFHLQAADPSGLAPASQDAQGNQFTPKSVDVWIDSEHYVTLQMRIEGSATVDGNATTMTIEELRTYQSRDGLFEPFERRMRIAGLSGAMNMTDQERRDLEKARRDVERMKAEMAANQAQLAQLPQAQRDMITRRLDTAIQQLEAMSSGGALETTTRERIIEVNKGPPVDWRPRGS